MTRSPVQTGGGFAALMHSEMAFFTWDLGKDLVFGDVSLACLFDIARDDLAIGVPILTFVEKICPDDRARVAQSIHSAIETGSPYQETYSILHRSGEHKAVAALGRCFRSIDGVPSIYTGVIIEVTGSETLAKSDPLEIHCRAALEIANQNGKELVSRYLRSALGVIRNGGH